MSMENNVKDYVGENDNILKEWLEQFINDGYEEKSFCEDGIMFKGEFSKDGKNSVREPSGEENSLWHSVSPRILFLTKDQNAQDGQAWDLRTETYRRPNSNPCDFLIDPCRFKDLLVYTVYGLSKTTRESSPGFDSFSNKEALEYVDKAPFARINCKKKAGESSCSMEELEEHMGKYKDFLKEQIDNLDADILVCCCHNNGKNPFIEFLNNNGYEFVDQRIEKCSVWYDKENNKIAIDSYHLSYCGQTEEWMYEDVVKSYHLFLKNKDVDFPPKR